MSRDEDVVDPEKPLAVDSAADDASAGPSPSAEASAPEKPVVPEVSTGKAQPLALKKLVAPKTAESIRSAALPFMTAVEIASAKLAEVKWIVTAWVAAGCITVIDGKPKAAGKTTFLLHMIRALTRGDDFLEMPTSRTAVVLLTEERPTTFRRNLKRIGLLETDTLHVLFHHDLEGTPWSAVMAQAVAKCREVGAELLIIDTLAQFSGISETNSKKVMETLQPVQAAAATGIAVICVRHERKSGGNVGDSGRGSSALTGAVDIIMAIKRPPRYDGPIRFIEALSRFEETPSAIAVELGDHGYFVVDDVQDVGAQHDEQKVLEKAPLDETAAKTVNVLMLETGLKKTVLREALARLLEAGALLRKGEGAKNAPFKFWRAVAVRLVPSAVEVEVEDGEPAT